MIDSTPSLVRNVAIALALLVVVVLLFQTQTSPVVISSWSGGAPRSMPAAISGQTQAISGVAQPQGQGLGEVEVPQGNPLGSDRIVLTQGYGVGSHAPAEVWGGLDLALDGNGDGAADPEGTLRAPIYATHSGTARVKPNTWPAGNYLSISNEHYKTAFAHLDSYAVEDGQEVKAGQVIGYIGVTGQSSGPHLHYEVWKDGVNVNPLDYGALDKTK